MSTIIRRQLLVGLGALVAAPAIVRASSLMPIKAMRPIIVPGSWHHCEVVCQGGVIMKERLDGITVDPAEIRKLLSPYAPFIWKQAFQQEEFDGKNQSSTISWWIQVPKPLERLGHASRASSSCSMNPWRVRNEDQRQASGRTAEGGGDGIT